MKRAVRWIGAAHSMFEMENELLVSFRAMRNADKKLVWEKEIESVWKTPKNMFDGCLSAKCGSDRLSDYWNQRMAGLLAEARADLVETLASLSEGGIGRGVGAENAGSPAGESLGQTIDRILKEK